MQKKNFKNFGTKIKFTFFKPKFLKFEFSEIEMFIKHFF